ncbi:MAG TPA: hypothetical protein VGH84_09310 [Steroidobacteraceae bacterium]|jgi:hypothetical protein
MPRGSGVGFGGRTKTSGQGRKPGVPNTLNRSIKEMIVGALCAAGGQDYLQRQAEQNPVAFMGLVGRVLPLQVTGENGAPIAVDFRWADALPAVVTIEADEQPISVTFVDTDNG